MQQVGQPVGILPRLLKQRQHFLGWCDAFPLKLSDQVDRLPQSIELLRYVDWHPLAPIPNAAPCHRRTVPTTKSRPRPILPDRTEPSPTTTEQPAMTTPPLNNRSASEST